MTTKIVKAAVVQAAPVMFDIAATLERCAALVGEAAGQGAELVVFPEAFIGGYPKGLDFGARVGSRSPAGRRDFERYYNAAITLPGPELECLAKVAARHRVHLVIGVIESERGTLYCSAVYLGLDGSFLGKHRKVMPTAMERLVWGCGDGSTLQVVATDLGRLGAVICWENYMPLLRQTMYAQGVELYCAPTVDDREVWGASMRHIAVEGRCFVLSACQYARRADYPPDYDCIQGDDPAAVMIAGGSCIVSPFGEVLAGPLRGGPGILYAELEMAEIVRGKYDLDVAGHYSRGDLFRLEVETRPAGFTTLPGR